MHFVPIRLHGPVYIHCIHPYIDTLCVVYAHCVPIRTNRSSVHASCGPLYTIYDWFSSYTWKVGSLYMHLFPTELIGPLHMHRIGPLYIGLVLCTYIISSWVHWCPNTFILSILCPHTDWSSVHATCPHRIGPFYKRFVPIGLLFKINVKDN